MDKGIDYGLGKTNIDHITGIRFGVIPMNDLNEFAMEDFEPYYGDPTCPKCGGTLRDGECVAKEYFCNNCYAATSAEDDSDIDDDNYTYWSDEAFPDEALAWVLDDGRYQAEQDDHGDVFITKSPYFTYAQFCSPCAPGAGYLRNFTPDGVKTYCFGHDWFEGEKAPYPVYSVETGELVNG